MAAAQQSTIVARSADHKTPPPAPPLVLAPSLEDRVEDRSTTLALAPDTSSTSAPENNGWKHRFAGSGNSGNNNNNNHSPTTTHWPNKKYPLCWSPLCSSSSFLTTSLQHNSAAATARRLVTASHGGTTSGISSNCTTASPTHGVAHGGSNNSSSTTSTDSDHHESVTTTPHQQQECTNGTVVAAASCCPTELLPLILAWVRSRTTRALEQSCTFWYHLLQQDATWRVLCEELYKVRYNCSPEVRCVPFCDAKRSSDDSAAGIQCWREKVSLSSVFSLCCLPFLCCFPFSVAVEAAPSLLRCWTPTILAQ